MERTNRAVTNRKSKVNARNARGMYVDGNTVRRLQEVPARRSAASRKPSQGNNRIETRTVSAGKPKVNPQRQRTRERAAMSMGRGFVAFLAVMSVAVLFCCVNYLQLKAELTGKIKNVASLETEWSQLEEENDAYESQVTSETDLNQIKKIAIGRLGMTYPSDTQKRTYSVPSSSYVRQYQDVPESKR